MHSIQHLDAIAASQLLEQNNAILVDVREAHEYAREHIAGSRLVPLSRLDASELPRDKPLIVCCASGMRSQTAIYRLLQDGFTALANMRGGLLAWKAAGLPTRSGCAAQSV